MIGQESVAELKRAHDTLAATDNIAIDAAQKVTENVTTLNCPSISQTTPGSGLAVGTPHSSMPARWCWPVPRSRRKFALETCLW